MAALDRDIRYALRRMFRARGFTSAVVIIFAIGAGANATVFSVLNALALNTLPVPRPNDLVLLHSSGSLDTIEIADRTFAEHYGAVPDLFDGVLWDGGVSTSIVTIEGVASEAQCEVVSANYFAVLDISAAAGHLVGAPTVADPLAVLDFHYWSRVFAGESSAIGRQILVDGVPHTIAGVAPKEFFGLAVGIRPDVYTLTDSSDGSAWAHVVGRLKPGRSAADAERTLTPVFAAAVPGSLASATERLQHMARLRVTSIDHGLSHRSSALKEPAWLLMSVSMLLLLVAGSNLANLVLARNIARRTEIATQIACGASRGRLVAQFSVEAGLLALVGGLAGLLVAHWTSAALVTALAGNSAHIVLETGVSVRLLFFTLTTLFITVGLFGILPTLITSNADPVRDLRAGSAGQGQRIGRLVRHGLVIGQLAGAVALLAGTGVLFQSLLTLAAVDVGFSKDRVLSVSMTDAQRSRPAGQAANVLSVLVERTLGLPGVEAVSLSAVAPFSGRVLGINVTAEGGTTGAEKSPALWTSVSSGYFATMGIPLREGRDFSGADDPIARPAAIVNETLARRLFGSASPLGRRLRFVEGNRPPMAIVGVVADAVYRDTREERTGFVYVPRANRNSPSLVGGVMLVRSVDPYDAHLVPAVHRLAAAVDKGLVIRRATVLGDDVAGSLHRERSMAELSAVVTAMALVLAGFGLYGTLSMTTAQRTREIGLRIALGASNRHVLRMVLGEAASLGAVGLFAGVFLAGGVLSILGRFVVDLPVPGALTMVLVIGTLLTITLAAAILPVRRALGISAASALKGD